MFVILTLENVKSRFKTDDKVNRQPICCGWVRFKSVHPGPIDANTGYKAVPMTKGSWTEQPLGRFGKLDEIANVN